MKPHLVIQQVGPKCNGRLTLAVHIRIELLNGKLKRRIYKTSGIILNAKHLLIIVHCCPVIPKSGVSVSMGSTGGATSGQLLPPENQEYSRGTRTD